jgi:ribosomal protein S6--L-glutamate ligase
MEWKELAVKATQALELDVAGVDMVWGNDGPLVLEVNTTPGFRELERVTRKDIAACIVEAAMDLARGG